MQVQVVAKASLEARAGDARLLRIELPWVQVKNGGLAVVAVHAADERARQRIRKKAEIAAAACRQIAAREPRGADRDLEQPGLRAIREARRVRSAVVIVAH